MELRTTLPLVEIIVVTCVCVTLPVGVVLEDGVWEDLSFDIDDPVSAESLGCSWVVEVVELVLTASWAEVVKVSEDVVVVESVGWVLVDRGIGERLAEELGRTDGVSVVLDVLLS